MGTSDSPLSSNGCPFCAQRDIDHLKHDPSVPGAIPAVLGRAPSAVSGMYLHPSGMLYGWGVIHVSTTAPEMSFSWSYTPGC